MNKTTLNVTYSGLLHELGILFDDTELSALIPHSEILEAILSSDRLSSEDSHHMPLNSYAYIINLADKIVTKAERHSDEDSVVQNASKQEAGSIAPLYSVFNVINENNLSYYYHMTALSERINYPEDKPGFVLSSDDYKSLADKLKSELHNFDYHERAINAMLSILETNLAFVPSGKHYMAPTDIPLYDHCKLTAAVASCICEYLSYNDRIDFGKEFSNKDDLNAEKLFLMFHGDFSGIQSFIYNVVFDGALKSLRSRSFFLELTMEHIVDELLAAAGVSRANLIYSGGGHCYLLLPNTKQVIEKINTYLKRVNKWLRESFGTKLYYAYSYTDCSANDLMNIPYEDGPYEQIFRRLSRTISTMKMHRYSPDEIIELNTCLKEDRIRECRICGTEDRLVKEDNICHWCKSFDELSNKILNKKLVILMSDESISIYQKQNIKLPGLYCDVYCYFTDADEAVKLKDYTKIKQIYTKNHSYPALRDAVRLYIGDYVFDPLIDNLVSEEGINKIAILRADVDDLGMAFISGFTRHSADPKIRNQYNTLSRTAVFSRQISLFFKYYLNSLLDGNEGIYNIPVGNEQFRNKRIDTVYSGGDDVFLIGNIKDILETAIMLNNAFSRYTCNTLHISFGIGIYPTKYPIYLSATDTEELESMAKGFDGKNSISLFTANKDHTYKLDIFRKNVLEDKLLQLNKFFSYNGKDQERGTSFLHRLVELIKNSNDRINIARCAYLIARLEPTEAEYEYRKLYQDFSKTVYGWILNPDDRKELLTASYIYIYLTWKRSE